MMQSISLLCKKRTCSVFSGVGKKEDVREPIRANVSGGCCAFALSHTHRSRRTFAVPNPNSFRPLLTGIRNTSPATRPSGQAPRRKSFSMRNVPATSRWSVQVLLDRNTMSSVV